MGSQENALREPATAAMAVADSGARRASTSLGDEVDCLSFSGRSTLLDGRYRQLPAGLQDVCTTSRARFSQTTYDHRSARVGRYDRLRLCLGSIIETALFMLPLAALLASPMRRGKVVTTKLTVPARVECIFWVPKMKRDDEPNPLCFDVDGGLSCGRLFFFGRSRGR
jgi:hypothetical protein